ncbi:MAG TPA: hypothetical protein VF781_11685 [Solirubrobacteraceae bacterium]
MTVHRWVCGFALAALLLLGALVLEHLTSGLTFWADEWEWILHRRGSSLATYLAPHNPHLSLVPIAIYKALFAIVGLRHYWPYRALLIADQLLCVTLVFIYARRRVGAYVAVLAAAMIMFFGPGWQDLLWTFQIGWLTPVAAGVGALLLLDRRDRRGDIGACALLIVGLASAGPALAVAVGVLVDVIQRRRPRDLWIPGVPIALYALWAVFYETSSLDIHAVPRLPAFVLHAAAGVFSSLAGVAAINVSTGNGAFISRGIPILIIAVALGVWRLVRLRRIPARVVTLAVIPLAFWVITGASRAYIAVNGMVFSFPSNASRYLYIGAVFVVLLAVELLRGWRPSLPVAAVLGLAVAATLVPNLGTLHDGSTFLHQATDQTEGALAGLQISQRIVAPTFVSNGFIFGILTAGPWFSAEHELGSAAVIPGPIPKLDPNARQAADGQLIRIQGLAVRPHPAGRTAPGCLPVPAGTRLLTLPPTGMTVRAGTRPVTVGVVRFAPSVTPLGRLPADELTPMSVRADLSATPWRVRLSSSAPFAVCRGAAPGA